MGFCSGRLDLVKVLETAYDVEQPQERWLDRLLEALAPGMDQGLGLNGYFVDLSCEQEFKAWGFWALGAHAEERQAGFEQWRREAPPSLQRQVHLFGPCGIGSRLPPEFEDSEVEASNDSHGFADVLGLNALDATGRGCAVMAPCPVRVDATALQAELEVWSRVSSHIAAAARLRRSLASPVPASTTGAEAVLSPTGQVLHVEADARDRVAREALRDAALRIERARRCRKRCSPQELTDLWQALVSKRWSLLDCFERDGRRYLIARRNEPVLQQRSPLTAREAQVVAAASLGHSNKLIAYELDLSTSAVSTHLSRAAAKLGVSGRAQLIRVFHAFAAPSPTAG